MDLDLSVLNEVQRQAVKCINGPVIVSAGAGSGKTSVLTYRVAYLLTEDYANPENILAITFTNKAAGEMRERLNNMLTGIDKCTISTFHALGVRILRECSGYISPRTRFFTVYDDTDTKNLMKKILKDMDEDSKMVDGILDSISNAKNAGITPDCYASFYGNSHYALKLAKIYEEYENQLEKNNAFDFDDLLCKTYDLLKKNITVRERYTNKYKYILVDEFQDTNEIQYNLLKLLQSQWHNIFVVGDEDQSIYSWRGADSHNMMKFIKDYSCEHIFKLEQNYRSTDKILDCANKIIKKNTDRLDKKLWTTRKGGANVDYHYSNDERLEAEYIVKNILALTDYGSSYKDILLHYYTGISINSL